VPNPELLIQNRLFVTAVNGSAPPRSPFHFLQATVGETSEKVLNIKKKHGRDFKEQVELGVPTAVSTKMAVFWVVAPCRLV
jgi:hypothetical protein